MSLKNIILLKFISLFLLLAYFTTYAWISFLFLLSELYAPFKNNIISFETMVIAFCVSVIFLTIYKGKSKAFMQILAQDIIILVLAVPMVSTLLDLLKMGMDDKGNVLFAILTIMIVTVGIMTFNDWKKIKMNK
nr:hypothetical protein [Pseudopedobacter sp.]